MGLEQILNQTQKLVLTQSMQQALTCLTLSAQDLAAYLRDAALSNPVLELEEPAAELRVPMPDSLMPELRERVMYAGGRADPYTVADDANTGLTRPQSFTEYLDEQLRQMQELDDRTCGLCRYLVGCLNSAGYLDCSLTELAGELGCTTFALEQALFIVQTLEPVGVGARNVEECLVLQLVQSRYFTARNLHLIQSGLPQLAAGDYKGLCTLLHADMREVRESAGVIRSLNPIPSRGFYSETTTPYIIPEASFRSEGGKLIVEMNPHAQPLLTLNSTYCAMLGQAEYADAQDYLRENVNRAKALKTAVDGRADTLSAVLSAIARQQADFFLHGQPLSPMTMGMLAETLGLNISTISRAVKDKYVEWDGRVLPLRSLFSAAVNAGDGEVSPAAVQHQMRRFLAAENPEKPLSDEALRGALESVGLSLSRRTVAKYRTEMGIANAAARRRPLR